MISNYPVVKSLVAIAIFAGLLAPAQAALRVFACEAEWRALVLELVPDAKVVSATHAGQDPHHIEARPSLIAALRRAELAVCTGASLEAGWLPALQARASNPDVHDGRPGMFYASEHTTLRDVNPDADRSQGDVHPEGNPHVHLDPEGLLRIAEALAKRISNLRPDLSDGVASRLEQFSTRWTQRIAQWRDRTVPLQDRGVVVQHTAFTYLLAFAGVRETADLEPLPGLPPTVSHLRTVLERIEGDKPIAIMQTQYQRPQAGEWLAERSGLPLIRLPATVTDDPAMDALDELYDAIIDQLLKAASR